MRSFWAVGWSPSPGQHSVTFQNLDAVIRRNLEALGYGE